MATHKVKEAAKDLLEELHANVPLGYKVENEAEEKFLALSDLADLLADEFGAESVDLDAASSTTDGTICIDIDEVVFEYGRRHPFFEYIKAADFLSFSKTKGGLLCIWLVVKGLLVKS